MSIHSCDIRSETAYTEFKITVQLQGDVFKIFLKFLYSYMFLNR
jgi:hypothetical protein